VKGILPSTVSCCCFQNSLARCMCPAEAGPYYGCVVCGVGIKRVGVVLAGLSGCVGHSQQDVCGGGGVAGVFCIGPRDPFSSCRM
jgi:hypothetical protein